jgi:hypothetical protein
MRSITFRSILREAWSITFKNPWLWVLGFFAALTLNTGIFQSTVHNIYLLFIDDQPAVVRVANVFKENSLKNYLDISNVSLGISPTNDTLAFALVTGLILFFIYLIIVSEIALIRSAHRLSLGASPKLSKAYQHSSHDFWQVLTINILARLSQVTLFVVLSIPLYISLTLENVAAVIVTAILFFLLYIPLSLCLGWTALYAINGSIIENLNFIESLAHGFRLLKNNIWLTVEIGLVLILVKVLTLLVTISIVGILFIPLSVLITSFFALNQTALFSLLLTLATIIVLATFLLINAVFTTYYLTCWTLLYDSVSGRSIISKLTRVVHDFFSKIVPTKHEQKSIMKMASVMPKRAIEAIENTMDNARPTLEKILDELAVTYREQKPTIMELKQQTAKALRKEAEKLEPTLERIKNNIEKKAVTNAPKVMAGLRSAAKTVKKEMPTFIKMRKKMQAKYKQELERELKKVLSSKKPTKAKAKTKKVKKTSKKK